MSLPQFLAELTPVSLQIFSRIPPLMTLLGSVFSRLARTLSTISLVIVATADLTQMVSAQGVTFTGSQAVNFGTANVCPSGQSTPAPCNKTVTLSYKVSASGTLGTPQVLTNGAPELDFTLGGGSTCAGSVTQGNTCIVNLTFRPIAPGARSGAVEIVDGSGNVLANTYIYGIGVGPLAGFIPAVTRTLTSTSGNAAGSVTVDGSGNVFFVSEDEECDPGIITEVLAVNGSISVNPVVRNLATGQINYPGAMAVDGAGNLFVANFSSCDVGSASITEILAAGGYTTQRNVASGFIDPSSIAVDPSGNLFVSDEREFASMPSSVEEFFAASGYATHRKLGGGFAFNDPRDLVMDSSGNVFVSDLFSPDGSDQGTVEEILAAGGYTNVKTIQVNSTDSESPYAITINPADNLFVSFLYTSAIAEFFAVDGVLPSQPAPLYLGNHGSVSAMDMYGNIFDANDIYQGGDEYLGLVQELELSSPPTLYFHATASGQTSTDSPRSVVIQNQGNATLDLTGLSVSSNWEQVAGSQSLADCTSGLSLAPGALCNISISFKPTEMGLLSGTVKLVTNNLNGTDSTQSIRLRGTGLEEMPLHITSLSAGYGAWYSNIKLTGADFGSRPGPSTVTFSGITAAVLSWSNTGITVSVPYRATTGNVVVTVNGHASNAVPFTVEATPSVSGISPTSGPVGTLVTISGQNLLDAEGHGQVWLNTLSLPIVNQSNTSLQVRIPSGAVTGVFDVHVNGVGNSTPVFTVSGTPADPNLEDVSPYYGALYAIVSLSGTGFGAIQGSSTVTFNGVPARAYVWTDTGITVTVPYRATSGNVVVKVGGKTSTYFIPFTIEPTPLITGSSPTSGPAGTVVTITGENLADANGSGLVWMGNLLLPVISQSSNSLQVELPVGVSTNPIDVHVNGVGVYTPIFTVIPSVQ